MPTFQYQALDNHGKNKKGQVEAENIKRARAILKAKKLYVLKIVNTQNKSNTNALFTSKSISTKELSLMTRQLATLLHSHVPIVDSINATAEQTENLYLSSILFQVKTEVNEGADLYKALKKYPKVFDLTFLSMIEAGESSGTLDVILLRLAEFTETQSALISRVKSAMMYPILMMFVMTGLMVFLFTVIIPKITGIFDSTPELTLEWYTLAVIDFSNFLITKWPLIILSVGVFIFSFRNWKNSIKGRRKWNALVLKLPLVGKMIRMLAVSRFARTLSTLLNGGVPMLEALQIVRNVVNNDIIAEAIDQARDNIKEGESIAAPLKASGQFPPMLIHMVNIGEKTGNLEEMLSQVSDAYDFQVNTSIDGLTALLEPLMIVFMGGLVGAIVFAVIMPILQLSNLGG
ncbi:MAG: type II secretion system inner membrane protein GspF [Bdellovibrionaceae bacterium]|nr:type II secretion system inner membrane protein GspF [Pseudobdellovibrionaceae bacterium]